MSTITKHQIIRALNKWPKSKFEYGISDCCQFASFMVKELTGVDYAAKFNYDSEESAFDIMSKHNGLVGLFTSLLGESTTESVDGSPCIVYIDGTGEAGGIKYGNLVVCVTQNGLAHIPESKIIASWNLWPQ